MTKKKMMLVMTGVMGDDGGSDEIMAKTQLLIDTSGLCQALQTLSHTVLAKTFSGSFYFWHYLHFHKWGHQSTEGSLNLPQIALLVSGRARPNP